MSSVIAALVSLSCVLIVVGLVVKAMFGNATVLKLGALTFLVACLPAIAIGLYDQMAAATPGGLSGFGLVITMLILSGIAYAGFKVWLALRGGSNRKDAGFRVERKRPIADDADDD